MDDNMRANGPILIFVTTMLMMTPTATDRVVADESQDVQTYDEGNDDKEVSYEFQYNISQRYDLWENGKHNNTKQYYHKENTNDTNLVDKLNINGTVKLDLTDKQYDVKESLSMNETKDKSQELLDTSYNDMECRLVGIPTQDQQQNDGNIIILFTAQYEDESDNHDTHLLKHVWVSIYSGLTLIYNTMTDENGQVEWYIAVPYGGTRPLHFKVKSMDCRSDEYASGWVTNGDSYEIYQATSGSTQYDDDFDYAVNFIFYDSDNSWDSLVGAAEIYDWIHQAKDFIFQYDQTETETEFQWAPDIEETATWYPQEGPIYVTIGWDRFQDDAEDEVWRRSTTSPRHEYGHIVNYYVIYEELMGANDEEHYWYVEHSSRESAFSEALADVFVPAIVNNEDPGVHSYEWHQMDDYIGDTNEYTWPTFHGDYVESAITYMLWDIIDGVDTGGDGEPDADTINFLDNMDPTLSDDFDGEYAKFLYVMDYWEPLNINEFWYAWQATYTDLDDELEPMYIKNNLGVYEYASASSQGTVQGLQLIDFEIWGCNPTPVVGQRLQVKYVLYNTLQNTVTFESPDGAFVAARDPFDHNIDFGQSMGGHSLFSHNYMISMQDIVLTDAGEYQFWPWFDLVGQNPSGFYGAAITISVDDNTLIFKNFENGVWPTDWEHDDDDPTSGYDYWDVSSQRASTGVRSLWCSEIGDQIGMYDNDMIAWFKITGDFHYIYFSIQFDIYPDIADGDYMSIVYWTGDQWKIAVSFTQGQQVWDRNVWYGFWDPDAYIPGGDGMKIMFVFCSDPNGVSEGVYLDNLNLFTA